MVSGNILASAHGGVGYLQPRGRVSSPFIHHLPGASSRFAIFKKHFKVVFCTSVISCDFFEFKSIQQYWINLVCQTQISHGVDRLDSAVHKYLRRVRLWLNRRIVKYELRLPILRILWFYLKAWFLYVGKIPDDRGFYFFPTIPDVAIYRICARGLSQIFPLMNNIFVIGDWSPVI